MEISSSPEIDFEEEFINNDRPISYELNSTLHTLDIQPLCRRNTMVEVPQNNSKATKNRSLSAVERSLWPLFADKNNHPPRKEYVREKLIRGFKRAIRIGLEGKCPKSKITEVNLKVSQSKDAWNILKGSISADSSLFRIAGKTENGPNTDGKSKRKGKAKEQSYNDSFCKLFFRDQIILNAFMQFVELVFSERDCKILERKFEFRTVFHKANNCNHCEDTWLKLKSYISHQMIADLYEKQSEAQIDI